MRDPSVDWLARVTGELGRPNHGLAEALRIARLAKGKLRLVHIIDELSLAVSMSRTSRSSTRRSAASSSIGSMSEIRRSAKCGNRSFRRLRFSRWLVTAPTRFVLAVPLQRRRL